MTNETQNTQDKPTLNKPFLLGYSVRPTGEGNKSYWNKIAVA